jgi:hypothetical protein
MIETMSNELARMFNMKGAEREENIWGPLDTECIV